MSKKVLIPLVLVILLGAIGVVTYLMSSKAGDNNKNDSPQTQQEIKQQEIKTLKVEDIGLALTPRADNKAIFLTMTKLSGISSFEYQVGYDAEVVEDGEKIQVPRGVVGSPVEIKSGEKEIRKEIILGTCSRNVCKYDKVVSDVKVDLKINFANGEIGSIEEKISL